MKKLPPIGIVSDAEAEKADFVVCVPADWKTSFSDNLTGFCSCCGVKVQYRWHAPRLPKRICVDCLLSDASRRL